REREGAIRDQDDPDRHVDGYGSRGERNCPQPGAPRGKRHGDLFYGPRPGREAVRSSQRGSSNSLSSGPPSAADQSGERRLLARGGGGGSDLGGDRKSVVEGKGGVRGERVE